MSDPSLELTLAEVQERYPWPADTPRGRAPLEYLWHWDFPVPAARLWPHLSDTSRFNRALGLGEMHFEEREGVLHGSGSAGGFAHEWVEVPWQWVSDHFLIAARKYSRGFQRYVRVIYHVIPSGDDGVRLYVYFGFVPKGALSAWALKYGMKALHKRYTAVLGELVDHLAKSTPTPYVKPAPPLMPDVIARVDRVRQKLAAEGFDGKPLERLVEFLATGDEMDLYRLQLRQLAREWGFEEEAMLHLFLHATREGLLQLSWDVMCPHCRGVREEARTLGDVPSRGTCEACDIDFDTDSDNAIEITFHVHPAVRDVPKLYFCSAEPSTKPHIFVQQALAGGAERRIETRLQPGRYRLRLRGQKEYRSLDVVAADDAPGETSWSATDEVGEEAIRVAPNVALSLSNPTGDEVGFIVEQVDWSDLALRPPDLFNMQDFRDIFSEEYLGVDVQLSLGEQTILFTDMVGSTKFYASQGDPEAFSQVKKHFVELFEEVGKHRGAVVKTIGDAAMASFSNPIDALRASRAILLRFPAGRADMPIRLRISLNTGPCIAVNLNAAIDYFGGTVNVAAKLQACCESGEIAFSQDVLDAPGVREYLESEGVKLVELSYEVKALGETIPVYRWDVNP